MASLVVSTATSSTCTTCKIGLIGDSSSALTLSRNVLTTTKVWNPFDDRKDVNGSHHINRVTHGGLTKMFLKPTLPFSVNFSGF
jgi:hypothetical protein